MLVPLKTIPEQEHENLERYVVECLESAIAEAKEKKYHRLILIMGDKEEYSTRWVMRDEDKMAKVGMLEMLKFDVLTCQKGLTSDG